MSDERVTAPEAEGDMLVMDADEARRWLLPCDESEFGGVVTVHALRSVIALHERIAELEEAAEMACQEPRDGCDCPGCRYADEKGGYRG